MKGARARPSCGHKKLVECPLSADDWCTVYMAWVGFLAACRAVAEQAHAREKAKL